ncbi:MAG: hypothetical protein IPN71_03530 [Fibrobacteres bacterium]|nr:hypothetical protein [Fibrobacterota bacterium]
MTPIATLLFAHLFLSPSPVDTGDLYPFSNPVTELVGFKDARGRVRFPARFHNAFTGGQVLREVVPAIDTGAPFFLRRDGGRFGFDSAFLDGENMPYCMREGHIQFQDPATRRMGFFDARGRVGIPALYLSAGSFHGGYSRVIREGRQVCAHGKPRDSAVLGEHCYWSGNVILIDLTGKVVVDTFGLPMGFSPDWTSATIVDAEADTSRRTWKTIDGRILSIASTEHSFQAWLEANLPRLAQQGPGKPDFFPSLRFDPRMGWKAKTSKRTDDTLREVASLDGFLKTNLQELAMLFQSIPSTGSRQAKLPASFIPFEERIGAVDLCREYESRRNPVMELSWAAAGRTRTIRFVRWDDSWRILDLE